MLRFRNLGSGSSGNSTLIEAGGVSRTVRLLVDCGLGIRTIETRLAAAGCSADTLDAIFITHEHSDHIGCARQLALRHRIPVWMSHGTHAALGQPDFDGLLETAADESPIDLGELQVRPFTVPHDAREPLQLTCTDGVVKLGILTDLGHASAHVVEQLRGCHALLLECNHDPDLLAASNYPPFLKRRVGGDFGHLANQAAAALLAQLGHASLGHVVAAHLSAQNNRPDLARAALAAVLNRATSEVEVADAIHGTGWLTA